MAIEIAAFANCDDAVVFWKIDKPIPDCLGFALERETVDAQGKRARSYVENRVGFVHDPAKPGQVRPSTVWPFQRFSWADHKMDLGDRVRYRVAPMLEDAQGKLHLPVDQQSEWTEELALSGETADGFSCFFNRGLVISQFMARYLRGLQKEHPGETREQTLARFKASLDEHEAPIRRFLSGELRTTMLDQLGKAKKGKGHVFGALYELSDDELVGALVALGARAHVVLANGSVKKKGGDQNAAARARLKKAKVEVHDRMVAPSALAHNKFLVFCDAKQKPLAAWSGSTNWTKTGLCTQINNGILIDSRTVAAEYLAQWERLRDAGSEFPKALVAANSVAKPLKVGKSKLDLWFTRTAKAVDMAALDAEIAAAKDAILFLMFMPGAAGQYKTVRARMKQAPSLYVHGVVSDLPKLNDESKVDVTLVTGGAPSKKVFLKIIQPTGIRTPFASWAATVTRDEFKANIGNAIVHSKLVVIDPFTRPVVITGSHNFSKAASGTNDENFLIVRGNRALAEAYAVHIRTVYRHYRWLAYVASKQAAKEDPWSGLSDDPSWQKGYMKGASRREIDFWVR